MLTSPQQKQTAQAKPAPFETSGKKERSAFAYQCRSVGRLRGGRIEEPAHADLEVMRLEIAQAVERLRPVAGAACAVAVYDAGFRGSHVQEAVAKFELQIVGHVVGETRMHRPGERPGGLVGRSIAEAGGAVGN